MKSRHYIVFALVILAFSIGSYLFGIRVFRDAAVVGLNETQVMLAFNHLRRYEELHRCLMGPSTEAVKTKLEMSIISEKELIAKFLKTNDSEKINEYISLRYKDGIDSLKEFKSSRGSHWNEPACK